MCENSFLKKSLELCPDCGTYYVNTLDGLVKHITSERHSEMLVRGWLNELNNEPKETKLLVPAFDSVERCPKCDKNFRLMNVMNPSKTYKAKSNTIVRYCTCGYKWHERCADGSEPIWEEIE